MKTKLTDDAVKKAAPAEKPYEMYDSVQPGLLLRVQPSGVKSYVVTWGRGKRVTLGRPPAMTVKAARTQAEIARGEATKGGAPERTKHKRILRASGTVADACRAYVEAMRKGLIQPKHGRPRTSDECRQAASDADGRFERTVYCDRIGKIKLADLRQEDIEAWMSRCERGDFPALPPKKGRPPKARPMTPAGVNRNRTTLVAALNYAVKRRDVSAERAFEWANAQAKGGADNRRDVYLTREQRRALFEAAAPEVRDLIECVALTGCRPGDPAVVKRADYDQQHGTVRYVTKRHPRDVPLSPAARALFDRLAVDKKPNDYLFTHGGRKWTSDEWSQHFREAARAAGLGDDVVLYTLRHCWITDAITGGLDPLTVSKLAGTSLQMIQKHYGHLDNKAAVAALAKIDFLGG